MTSSRVMTSLDAAATGDSARRESRAPDAVNKAASSFRSLALSGTAWSLFNHGGRESMRLASHLICAWILDPAALGIMVLVNVVLEGLKMFSDVGTGPSIIQHERGDEPAFLNTAWTIQTLRHGALFIAALAMAWPLAHFRPAEVGQPSLLLLLPVAAFSTLLDGFLSTSPSTLHRHIRIRTLTGFNLSTQFLGSVSTIIAVIVMEHFWQMGVWGLIIGGVARSLIRLVASHTVISQGRNWFAWDRDSVRDLVRFGRWIFVATALTFLCTQGDKLILAGFLDDWSLGLYGTAFFLAMGIPSALRTVTNMVLFPLFSKVAKEDPQSLRRKILKARLGLLGITIPPLCMIAIWAQPLINFMYSDAYEGVGWILQLLALGGIFHAAELTISPVLLARGDSFRHMLVLIARAVALLACMLIGGFAAGQFGVVTGIALSQLLYYPVLAWAVSRHGTWMPRVDLLTMAIPALIVAAGILLFN